MATAKKSKVLFHRKEGSQYVNLSGAEDNLKRVIKHYLMRSMGHYEVEQLNDDYSLSVLVIHQDEINDDLCAHDVDVEKGDAKILFDGITKFAAEMEEMLVGKLERGEIEFPDFPFLFKPGVEAITLHDGYAVAGFVDSVELKFSFMSGPFYEVKLKVIANTGGAVKSEHFEARFFSWRGYTPLNEIGIRVLTAEEKEKLTVRGEKYAQFAYGAKYAKYAGQVRRHSWYGVKSYRGDGRVMVDVGSFREIDSDQFSQEKRFSGIADNDHHHDGVSGQEPDIKIEPQDYWRCYPYLFGFSFKAKQWGRLDVEGLTEIEWRDDAWDKLVLANEEKTLVRAIVEHQAGSFTDIVEDKGGGSIFLLHGPPGQGKTLTAETIAEILHRPLYAISVGELGVSPDELEDRLRTILDLATVWNAVLLLDEADIFLEARDEKDIVRNAMVGVFLRLLEYHQGVLFLTTNRVKNIDQAFYSRISIGLEFAEADDAKRRKIWVNLLAAAEMLDKFSNSELDGLSEEDLNGRQIKNVIRLSQTLARSEGVDVQMAHLKKVIKLTGKFNPKTHSRVPLNG